MSDEGLNKSAILLMSLGEEEAAEVFRHLAPREVQKLGAAMAAIKNVSREKISGVLDEFRTQAEDKTALGLDSNAYIRTVLTKALGDDRAASLIERILQGGDTSGIEGLKWMDSPAIADLVKSEHPQIIATILVHLDREQAGEVLSAFSQSLRNDVVLRIALLDSIQPAALKELNDVLSKLLSGGQNNIRRKPLGGIRAAAEVLNFLGGAVESSVIENVRTFDADLAQKILDEMFVFEDLLDLDDRSIQLLLREVQSESLIIALKGASEILREKIIKNMSARAGEALREDLEAKGPVKVSEVEAEQKEILKIVRRLSDEGQIAVGKGEEAYV